MHQQRRYGDGEDDTDTTTHSNYNHNNNNNNNNNNNLKLGGGYDGGGQPGCLRVQLHSANMMAEGSRKQKTGEDEGNRRRNLQLRPRSAANILQTLQRSAMMAEDSRAQKTGEDEDNYDGGRQPNTEDR
eukprot:gene5941-biopygen4526